MFSICIVIHEDQSNKEDTSTLLSLEIKGYIINEGLLDPSLLGGLVTKSTINIVFSITNSILSCSIPLRTTRVVLPTINVNLRLFVNPCQIFFGWYRFKYCIYCHLLSGFSSKFNPP